MFASIRRGVAALFGVLPTVLVGTALAGLFYWGHTTNWTAPKFSEWLGRETEVEPDEKKPAAPDPDGPPVKRVWCEKHNVPDEQCVICHPELAAKTATPTEMKPVAVTFDPSALPTHDPRGCKLLTARIRFMSKEALQTTGLKFHAVREEPLATTVTAGGTLDYDPDRIAKLGPRAGGMVERLLKGLGDRFKAGEVLALFDAAEVGKAKADYLTALVQLQTRTRVREAMQPGAVADKTIKEAEDAVREARVHLYTAQLALIGFGLPLPNDTAATLPIEDLTRKVQYLGLHADLTASLPTNAATANLLPMVAPFAGEIVDRAVVAGEAVNARQVILTVADPSRLHAHLDVSPAAAPVLKLGQEVEFRADGDPGAVARGKLNWISPAVDERTRRLHVRAEFDNPDGRLRAKAFGTATITLRAVPNAVVVPEEAVQWEGCSHIVFVRFDELDYRVRRVNLGLRQEGLVEVLSGVVPGEVVVTTGSHVLKSELLKDRIGGDE